MKMELRKLLRNKVTYLGLEMTSSGRYTYAENWILSNRSHQTVLSIINPRSFSNTKVAAIAIKNKLIDVLVKHVFIYG